MKKPLSILLFIAICLLILLSCTERMTIVLPENSKKLVVEAYLFPGDSNSRVRLTQTADYFSNKAANPVSRAKINLDDGNSSWQFNESEDDSANYLLSYNKFNPVTGKTYHLDIRLANPIGNLSHFESQTTLIPLRIHIDSISIQYAPDIEKWMIRLFAKDSAGKDFYLFNSRVNSHWITDSIQRKVARSDVYFDGRYLSGAIVQVLNKNELHGGDHYELVASSISEDYYQYIISLQDEIEPKNPIFSGPSANVYGNISNGALGYFTAFASTSYQVILRDKRGIH